MLRTTPLSLGAGADENSMLLEYGQPVACDSSIKARTSCIDPRQQCRQPRRGCPATSESGGRPHLTPFAPQRPVSTDSSIALIFGANLRNEGGTHGNYVSRPVSGFGGGRTRRSRQSDACSSHIRALPGTSRTSRVG